MFGFQEFKMLKSDEKVLEILGRFILHIQDKPKMHQEQQCRQVCKYGCFMEEKTRKESLKHISTLGRSSVHWDGVQYIEQEFSTLGRSLNTHFSRV